MHGNILARIVAIAAFAIALTFGVYAAGGGSEAEPKPKPERTYAKAKITDLSWMQGRWVGKINDDPVEEVWGPPAGDGMVGMFRWTKSNQTWMCELLTIIQEEGTLVFRFKHFDRQMVGWEEKDKALTFKLLRHEPNEAVFDQIGGNVPWRYIYRKTAADALTVRFEQGSEANPDVTEIPFKRAALDKK